MRRQRSKGGLKTTSGEHVEQVFLARDLPEFVANACLTKYQPLARSWCEEMGCISVQELIENLDEFGAALGLRPFEVKRLRKVGSWYWGRQQGC